MSADEIWTLERGDAGYPVALEDLQERAPDRLYGIGDRSLVTGLAAEEAVTIVGARRASGSGRQLSSELAFELASAGLMVVSGMAFGCDAAAHQGALAAGKPTIAVLAGGPDVVYPPSKTGLHRSIADSGAVISEVEPGETPRKWGFPARNRIMAALAGLTIVIEGSERSGTRITADEATGLGRNVGAVPGRVGSKLSELPHELIRDGATLLRGAQDALDLMLGVGQVTLRRIGPALEPHLAAVLAALEEGCETCDAVAVTCGLDGGDAAVSIARLEILGYARSDQFGRLERSALSAP
jgi:DNA processing protein